MLRILILNVGSSSVKFKLYDESNVESHGGVYNIDMKNSYFKFNETKEEMKVRNLKKALNLILERLEKIDIIGHRVVHGGLLQGAHLIDKDLMGIIKNNNELAPLHNPLQLNAIKYCNKYKQYAVFDSLFFEEEFPIKKEIIEKFHIRKYGFHGLAHKSVNETLKEKNIISCHLGSGSSISLIENKKIVNNSMGFTPLDGVIMATRSGNIEPGLVLFLVDKIGYDKTMKMLYHESGFKGLTGNENIEALAKKNDKSIDTFVDSVLRYISYYFTKTRIEAISFSGGTGENEGRIRNKIIERLKIFDVFLDKKKNEKNDFLISSRKSKVKVYCVKIDEEEIMLKEILKLERMTNHP